MSTLKHENMFKLTQNSIFQKYLCAYAILKHCEWAGSKHKNFSFI